MIQIDPQKARITEAGFFISQSFFADLSRAKTCFPSGVRRYFCAGLFGDSGWVISIHSTANAGLR
jgi:hypothetical protein